jgi:amino acid transporter
MVIMVISVIIVIMIIIIVLGLFGFKVSSNRAVFYLGIQSYITFIIILICFSIVFVILLPTPSCHSSESRHHGGGRVTRCAKHLGPCFAMNLQVKLYLGSEALASAIPCK